jgi:hypothetical protein
LLVRAAEEVGDGPEEVSYFARRCASMTRMQAVSSKWNTTCLSTVAGAILRRPSYFSPGPTDIVWGCTISTCCEYQAYPQGGVPLRYWRSGSFRLFDYGVPQRRTREQGTRGERRRTELGWVVRRRVHAVRLQKRRV